MPGSAPDAISMIVFPSVTPKIEACALSSLRFLQQHGWSKESKVVNYDGRTGYECILVIRRVERNGLNLLKPFYALAAAKELYAA